MLVNFKQIFCLFKFTFILFTYFLNLKQFLKKLKEREESLSWGAY